MAINPSEILGLARELSLSADEVSQRSAASRAYYAAFHLCAPISDQVRSDPKFVAGEKIGSHDKVIRLLMNSMEKDTELRRTFRSMGIRLNASRDIRVAADYLIDANFLSSSTQTIFGHVEAIFQSVEALRKSGRVA